MKFISAPVKLVPYNGALSFLRPIDDPVAMMDNLVEMIVLTPKGTFNADPDFGFEFWDPAYTDVSALQFNVALDQDEYGRRNVKDRCEECIVECIMNYAPAALKVSDVFVEMNLRNDKVRLRGPRKAFSYREVTVAVSAKIDYGMGTVRDYHREISFMMEPLLSQIGVKG